MEALSPWNDRADDENLRLLFSFFKKLMRKERVAYQISAYAHASRGSPILTSEKSRLSHSRVIHPTSVAPQSQDDLFVHIIASTFPSFLEILVQQST